MTCVYGEYDQAALDAQYNNRARVPEHGEHLARWAEASAALRRTRPCRLDFAYGPSPAETLDFFPPTLRQGSVGAPLLVFIHGGYWQSLDKRDFSFVAPPYLDAGIAVAVVNYALAPAVGMDEILRQNRAAIAWLRREAGSLGIDGGRIIASGHSAGGHLAALLMLPDGGSQGLAASEVEGACALSGLYELEPIRLSYLNAALRMDGAVARRNSPVHCPAPASGWLMLAVGERESLELRRQQALLAAAWQGAGIALSAAELPGEDHFSILDRFAAGDSPLSRALRERIVRRQDSGGWPGIGLRVPVV